MRRARGQGAGQADLFSQPAREGPRDREPARANGARRGGARRTAAAPGPSPSRAQPRRATAEDLGRAQREISVSEFFTKNRHLLGFDNPRKALLTAVKEAVDNSLDACEEAGILPEVMVEIRRTPGRENRFTVAVEDNGPGIVRQQIPNIFGKLLYGSKFHRLRQSRGQQGIGISAAGMYGQLTTGNPMRIRSRTGKRAQAHTFEVRMDTTRNRPEYTEKAIEWDKDHGTRVEIDLEGEYRKGMRSVDEFMKLVAVANPHVTLRYTDPDGAVAVYQRASGRLPPATREIKPHPHGVELGMLIKLLRDTPSRWLSSFLQTEFSRVGPKVAQEILKRAGLGERANPRHIAKAEADRLKAAIDATRIMAPPTSCIAPIGEDLILAGLRKEVQADFYVAASRAPAVYRGNPFLVEAGIAYGRPGETFTVTEEGRIVGVRAEKQARDGAQDLMGTADEPARLIRFANRVPLLYQQGACAITRAVTATNWRAYQVQQPKSALPVGPMVLFVHIASVWVPFTSESKEAIAGYPEIQKELRLALMECGRKLGTHIRKGRRIASEYKKRTYIEKYIPHIGAALQEILGLSDAERDKTVARLTEVLEKSRKL